LNSRAIRADMVARKRLQFSMKVKILSITPKIFESMRSLIRIGGERDGLSFSPPGKAGYGL
jgi:hypothetical protein